MSSVSCISLVLIMAMGTSVEIQTHLAQTLEGQGNVLQVQRSLSELLGWRAQSPAGIVAGGRNVRVRDLDPTEVQAEVGEDVPVLHYFEVEAEGPQPVRVHVPTADVTAPVELYRRGEAGLYVRVEEPAVPVDGRVTVEVGYPGRFVARVVDEHSYPDDSDLLPSAPDPSRDPELRTFWRLWRVHPDQISGEIPLVLVHGLSNDRWGDFIHWATYSPEAADFRSRFQLWNFTHLMAGINAAIGFDPECPTFDESIVAWLHRFLETASTEGYQVGDEVYFFPDGPFAMVGHSHGVLKIRAFLNAFPEWGERCYAAVSLGGPNTGAPFSTVEWMRHTISRLGISRPNLAEIGMEEVIAANFLGTRSQSDLDLGWGNFDATIPHLRFRTWTRAEGRVDRVLSPRDAALSYARNIEGYEDDATFEPAEPLENFCGGLDNIMPAYRGDKYLDRFFLYGSYIQRGIGLLDLFHRAGQGIPNRETELFESLGLRFVNLMSALIKTDKGDFPASPFHLGDGYIPLQSQLFLDGQETEPVYRTLLDQGWRLPAWPEAHNIDVIRAHTLGDPDRIRILPGWGHGETVTGRYNVETFHSELFPMVADDLIEALPEAMVR
jgi:hypothetical protein